jgi:ATP-dependent exoDNAse (exonuclease V) alpha subunit
MDQSLALDIMMSGENVLLTGPAGAGKTFVLNEFISRAKNAGKTVAVTATTGLAATHLNGCTIHAWSGIGINDSLPKKFFEFLPASRYVTIDATDVLIIDEVSMLHDYRLDMVDEVCRKVRGDDSPFGGIQVILCGDFFQLPPVTRSGEPPSSFVVNAASYRDLDPVVCYLSEQHRQDDDSYLEILNVIRAGDVRKKHANALFARQDAQLDHDGDITELHTMNVDVDGLNARKLEALPGEKHYYEAKTTGAENYVDTLKRSCLALENLVLKQGALVMCVKNNNERRFVNGSLGTVIDFEDGTDYPIVKLNSGRTLTIAPETWELRDGDKKRAGLEQIPLRLAWAVTVHKSQGMTLDAARIDLRRTFVPGMGYVALSRVRNLESLSLLGMNRLALQVSEEALEIDKELQARSAKDEIRFAHLADDREPSAV